MSASVFSTAVLIRDTVNKEANKNYHKSKDSETKYVFLADYGIKAMKIKGARC